MKRNFSATLLLECSLGPKEWPKLGTKDSVHLCEKILGGKGLTDHLMGLPQHFQVCA